MVIMIAHTIGPYRHILIHVDLRNNICNIFIMSLCDYVDIINLEQHLVHLMMWYLIDVYLYMKLLDIFECLWFDHLW